MGRTPWKRHFLFAVLYILGTNSKSCPHPPVLYKAKRRGGGGLHLASFVFLCSLLRKRKEYLQPSATATLNHLLEKAGTKHHAKEMVSTPESGEGRERKKAMVGSRDAAIGGKEISVHFLYLLVSLPRPARKLGERITDDRLGW